MHFHSCYVPQKNSIHLQRLPLCFLQIACDEGVIQVEEAETDVVEDKVKALAQGNCLVVSLGECFNSLLLNGCQEIMKNLQRES